MPAVLGQVLGSSANLLQHHFKSLQFFWGNTMERAFDERGMPAKERNEHFASFFCQGYSSDPPVGVALDTADESLLIQAIHRHADRARIEVNLRADSIHRHRSLVQKHLEYPKIGLP